MRKINANTNNYVIEEICEMFTWCESIYVKRIIVTYIMKSMRYTLKAC